MFQWLIITMTPEKYFNFPFIIKHQIQETRWQNTITSKQEPWTMLFSRLFMFHTQNFDKIYSILLLSWLVRFYYRILNTVNFFYILINLRSTARDIVINFTYKTLLVYFCKQRLNDVFHGYSVACNFVCDKSWYHIFAWQTWEKINPQMFMKTQLIIIYT